MLNASGHEERGGVEAASSVRFSSRGSSEENAGCFGPSPPQREAAPTYTYPDAGGDAVIIKSQQVVGPYEAVTIRASNGTSVADWLRANGYPLGGNMESILDSYATAGFDFLALRFAPAAGAQATQPIRIVTPGSDTTLPLRMLAVAAETQVAIQLFVISTSGYAPSNFPTATLDGSGLVWDYGKQESNYEALAQGVLASGAGTTWLIEASRADLPAADGGAGTNLASIYAGLCQSQAAPGCVAESGDAGATDATAGDAGSGDAAGDAAAGDAATGDAAAGDADSAEAGSPRASDACLPTSSCDDFSIATAGLAGPLWVTRLRADLPPASLVTDLTLTVTQGQSAVSPDFQAYQMTDPYTLCPEPTTEPDCSSMPRKPRPRAPLALVALAALCAGRVLRRRARSV